ncbi:hypothetical protein AB1Y20_023276 [Prymnesium parvum]|uniref:Uncharacterized protein n=1 Tax=Prymnesium parvum TaxID=97485 RepID=A0AB34JE79_PRYPA
MGPFALGDTSPASPGSLEPFHPGRERAVGESLRPFSTSPSTTTSATPSPAAVELLGSCTAVPIAELCSRCDEVYAFMTSLGLERSVTARDARCVTWLASRKCQELGLTWGARGQLTLRSGFVLTAKIGELVAYSIVGYHDLIVTGRSDDVTFLAQGGKQQRPSRRARHRMDEKAGVRHDVVKVQKI